MTIADAVIDIREFPVPVKANRICEVVRGIPLTCNELLDRDVYGYTVVDSLKAILTLSGIDFYQLFGSTTERVAIFTNVTSGRSPMVAVKVHPLKPRMVVIHGPKMVDELAIRLAEAEQIPLVLSKAVSANDLIRSLGDFYQKITSSGIRESK